MKRCSTCKQEKALEQFGQCKVYADGKNPRCKVCVSVAQRRYYLKQKESGKKELEAALRKRHTPLYKLAEEAA
jgi:hypothetical protein